MGIEPTALAWDARVLPLYDARSGGKDAILCRDRFQFNRGRHRKAGIRTAFRAGKIQQPAVCNSSHETRSRPYQAGTDTLVRWTKRMDVVADRATSLD